MTRDYFIQLADYNIWANDIVHSWFDKITDEQWTQPVVSSFNCIAETALHVAGAETIWLDRLKKIESPVPLASVFKGSKKDLIEAWNESSKGLKSFIVNFDERKLQDLLGFKRLNGVFYELPYYQILTHVFNHSTYHRGQIVTMLRQVGFTNIASTDAMLFFGIKKLEYGNTGN